MRGMFTAGVVDVLTESGIHLKMPLAFLQVLLSAISPCCSNDSLCASLARLTMGKSARFVCPGAAAPVGIPGTLPTMTMDEALVAFLKDYHTGESNSISSRELERIYGVRGTTIRQMVNRLRIKGVPICSCDVGYYYAETEEEVSRTIRQLRTALQRSPKQSVGWLNLSKICQIRWSFSPLLVSIKATHIIKPIQKTISGRAKDSPTVDLSAIMFLKCGSAGRKEAAE